MKITNSRFRPALLTGLLAVTSAVAAPPNVLLILSDDQRWSAREFRDLYDPTMLPVPPNYLPVHPLDIGDMTGRDESLEAWPRTEEAVRRHLFDYYALITDMDRDIGRLLDALDRSGLATNTIVVFSSDQGIALGSHGLFGNYLLNVGPNGDGEIPPQAVAELERVGAWMKVNGEAIYGTQPNPLGRRPAWGEITGRGATLYLFPLRHRGGELVVTGLPAEPSALHVLGGAPVPFTHAPGEIHFSLPAVAPAAAPVVLALECAAESHGPLSASTPPSALR